VEYRQGKYASSPGEYTHARNIKCGGKLGQSQFAPEIANMDIDGEIETKYKHKKIVG
jgi:hypothetical protein